VNLRTPTPTTRPTRAARVIAHAGVAAPSVTGQGGYALVALLALMTIIMLAATAAAPNIIQQSQREAEREAIIRGEEVADAIEQYVRLMGPNRLPRSMEELLEGASPPGRTKKVRVLRSYAARDPLARTGDGEWRLVQPRGKEVVEFQQALMLYMEGRPLPPSPEAWKNQARVQLTGVTGLGRGSGGDDSGGEDTSANANVPFIGVASRSRRESVVTYFGIERHDEWVFTPIYR
jgi:type II secretory pathway pseudopilin PulG